MISLEEIQKFLPTFLSQGSEQAFLDEVKAFLRAQSKPFYTNALAHEDLIFQGDGLESLLLIKLPDPTIKPGRGMVLSNTCDLDMSNRRLFPSSICYAPILSYEKYIELIRSRYSAERVNEHEQKIKAQLITQLFFLPRGGRLAGEGLVFLDRIISVSNDAVKRDDLKQSRLFTLSDFGAWLLALKLSIHFSRIRDKVDRISGVIQ